MAGKAFFDGRNAFDKNTMSTIGFHYMSIGAPGCQHELEISTR
jgi:hypothetical protein